MTINKIANFQPTKSKTPGSEPSDSRFQTEDSDGAGEQNRNG